MEVIQAPMIDFFRRDEVVRSNRIKRGFVPNPFMSKIVGMVSERVYNTAAEVVWRFFHKFKFSEPHQDVYEMSRMVDDLVDTSYDAGEGWLMPAEIMTMANKGVNSFVIVQPFGCLPNHITGRGMVKSMKEKFPHIQILSLDYDPDTSIANVENRLQMLIITAKELEKIKRKVSPLFCDS